MAKKPSRGGFFGEPAGLGFLAFTEVWERFSYYGMAALLALYMSQVLLAPGHGPDAIGLPELKRALVRFAGARSPTAQAAEIYGLYSAGIYFSPVVGGMIADRWTGRRTAVVAGAVLMCLGLWERHRPAVLLVTHDVDEALALADRIVVLADGGIAHEATVDAERPRDRDDHQLTELRGRLLQELGVDQKGTAV